MLVAIEGLYTLAYLKENMPTVAVECRSQSEWNRIGELLNKAGYKWNGGDKYNSRRAPKWEQYGYNRLVLFEGLRSRTGITDRPVIDSEEVLGC